MRTRFAVVLAAVAATVAGLVITTGSAQAAGSSQCDAATGNLVRNCGFETGNLTDWTASGSFIGVDADSLDVHSGTYGLYLGTVGYQGTVAQTVTGTAASTQYWLSYWLRNPSRDSTPNSFAVQVSNVAGGPLALDVLTNAPEFPWTRSTYTFTTLANGTAPTITFQERNDPDYFSLDDVVVSTVPPPVLASALVAPAGGTVTSVSADGECLTWQSSGYAPYAPVTVIAYPAAGGAPVTLGTWSANGNGKVTVSTCLPDSARGSYNLLAAGYASNGTIHYAKASTIVQP